MKKEEETDQRRRSIRWKLERLHLRSLNVFWFSNAEFWYQFRVTKGTLPLILEEFVPHIKGTVRPYRISAESKIIATVRALAHRSHQRPVGNEVVVSMSQPFVSRSVREVIKSINEFLCYKHVKFPTSEDRRSCKKDWFQMKYKRPGLIGCVDGTQIGIYPPSKMM